MQKPMHGTYAWTVVHRFRVVRNVLPGTVNKQS